MSEGSPLAPYKWLSLVDQLAGGDFTKYDQVYQKNYIAALNTLSYWKTVADYQREKEKTARMMKNV